MQEECFQDCYASLSLAQDRLVLGNSRIERVFRWNHGHLISLAITDKEGGTTWPLAAIHPDSEFPGEAPPREGSLTAETFAGNAYIPPHLRVWVTTRLGELFIKRRFRIYPHTPAVGCDYYLKGKPVGSWTACGVPVSELSQLENAAAAVEGNMQHVTVERIHTTLPHPRFQSIQFMDVTDRRNNLVIAYPNRLSYRTPQTVAGQLLLVSDSLSERQLFILKEAPCTDVQLAGDGYD
ncbi:MAG: hypothetical protein D6820_12650, partial [Lentisphaerae bacterium]